MQRPWRCLSSLKRCREGLVVILDLSIRPAQEKQLYAHCHRLITAPKLGTDPRLMGIVCHAIDCVGVTLKD